MHRAWEKILVQNREESNKSICVSGWVISVNPDFSNDGLLIIVQDEEPQTSHCRAPGHKGRSGLPGSAIPAEPE